ncbi:MAG TPA: hypothetical protein VK034_15590 [Enhygromyxa sp.]|nr:hypothetical protein [Enhygromyxa sp.]
MAEQLAEVPLDACELEREGVAAVEGPAQPGPEVMLLGLNAKLAQG